MAGDPWTPTCTTIKCGINSIILHNEQAYLKHATEAAIQAALQAWAVRLRCETNGEREHLKESYKSTN
jgi:hypothetical protein